jgi:signal transduction histidine kinase
VHVLTWFFIGVIVGGAGCAGVAWFLLRRHLRRVRLAEQRARAAEHMAEIGAMTGGLAHEIKNPLSTIGLNVQLLLESIEDLAIPDDERSRLVSRMKSLRREVERLRGILTDFLEFAGKVHLERRPTSINQLVEELVDFFHPEAERHGVRVRAQLESARTDVPIDQKLVKQALLNLMLNATQAMAARHPPPPVGTGAPAPAPGSIGELVIRTDDAREPDGTPVVRLHVIDNGPGIPHDVLARIFQPYFTTRSGGSGLGLPTARRLIEEHAGRIEVRSEVGAGTEFTVVLPVDLE